MIDSINTISINLFSFNPPQDQNAQTSNIKNTKLFLGK